MHDGEFCQHIDEFSIEGIFGLKIGNIVQHHCHKVCLFFLIKGRIIVLHVLCFCFSSSAKML